MPFRVGSNCSNFRELRTRSNNKLIVIKEILIAFRRTVTLFTVAEQLINCLCNRLLGSGTFAFEHRQRKAVYEEDHIRNDVLFPSRYANLELADCEPVIVDRISKIDDADIRTSLLGVAILCDRYAFR